MTSRNRLASLVSALFLTGAASPAFATDLLQVYRLALDNDPQFQAARYTQDAGREKEAQGLAGLLPTLGVSGNTQWNDVDRDLRNRPDVATANATAATTAAGLIARIRIPPGRADILP